MEKVICTECGSIGYTASQGQVACKCDGKHKAIQTDYKTLRHKSSRILSLLCTGSG